MNKVKTRLIKITAVFVVNIISEAKLFPSASVYFYVIFFLFCQKSSLNAAHSSANYIKFVKLPVFILAQKTSNRLMSIISNGTMWFLYDLEHYKQGLKKT